MLAVVVATNNELRAALRFADAPSLAQGESIAFEIAGKEVLLHVCGVGPINAAMAVGRLLSNADVTGVLNLGIAGTYDPDVLPMGAAAYASQETWPEYGLLLEDGRVDPKAIGFPQGELSGKPVWNRVKLTPTRDAERMELTLPPDCIRVAGVTVASVTGTPERAGWLQVAHNGDMENMEGFALAFGAMQAGLPFLEVRTVSNLVGSRAAEDWNIKGALRALGNVAEHLFNGR